MPVDDDAGYPTLPMRDDGRQLTNVCLRTGSVGLFRAMMLKASFQTLKTGAGGMCGSWRGVGGGGGGVRCAPRGRWRRWGRGDGVCKGHLSVSTDPSKTGPVMHWSCVNTDTNSHLFELEAKRYRRAPSLPQRPLTAVWHTLHDFIVSKKTCLWSRDAE